MTNGKEKDRFDSFRAQIQFRLESRIEHVGHQARFAKMWPERAEGIKQELKELDESIAWLRDVVSELDDFEREEERAKHD